MSLALQLQAAIAAIAANQPRLRSRLRALVELESPSDNKAAVDGANDLVAAWALALGARVKRRRQKHFGDVLELHFNDKCSAARSRPGHVLLLGHLDTVWPLGTLAKMPWREADGKLYGPGILDMKAGVVMAFEAIAALQSLQAKHGPITLLLNSDEEVGSPVSLPITERLARTAVAVYVLEPAQGLAYKTARKGVGHFELHVTGIAAHSGVDFTAGHSAILEMSRLIQQVSAFTNLAKGRTINVGVVTGGTRSNVIAADCHAEIDVRIAKASDAVAITRLFDSLRPTDKACKLTLTGGINRPPMERKPGTVALFRQARRLARELGWQLEEVSTGGGSDGNFTAALGVPTLDGMGAVGAGAHAPHEHVVITHLVERTTLLAAMLATAPIA